MDDSMRMALPSDGFFIYTWFCKDGEKIPLTVTVKDADEARLEGLDLLDRVFEYEKTLDYRKIIETTDPVLIGPYLGPIFY